tara:strand:- start:492 stop:686 length:195 start_codon:yes stop_codon:yes gene_type:complete
MTDFRYSRTKKFIKEERVNGRTTQNRRNRRFKSMLHRDLLAMREVWKMLKNGAIRSIGEIGRQY